MRKKLASMAIALSLLLGMTGTGMLVNAETDAEKNYFPSEGFENMVEEGETEFPFSEAQRHSIGSLSIDSHAIAKKEANGNVYVQLSQSDEGKPFSSFFAMLRLENAGDYNVSVDFYKEEGWVNTDNLGFRFYGAHDSKGWAKAINDAAVGEWVTLTEVYTVSATEVTKIDSFQMWFNTKGTNVLRVDNVSIKEVPAVPEQPTVEKPLAEWREADPADVVFDIDLKGQELVSVTNVAQDLELTSEEYALNAEKTQLTIMSDYIADLGEGEWEFKIATAGGEVSVYVTAFAKKGEIPDSTEGYTLKGTLLAGDFEKYEVGLVFSETQTEEAWGSVGLDDPAVIAEDAGSHVLKLGKKEGSSKSYASAFAMTSPEIQQDDIVTLRLDYKIDVESWDAYLFRPNVTFVGASNQSYHEILLDGSNHPQTQGVAENKWDIKYTELDNGYTRVEMSFIVDFAFLNATNSIRFLMPIVNDTDALYIDNVALERWINDEEADAEVPEITPATATFDNNAAKDVVFTVDLKDYVIGSIKLDNKIVASSNYTLTENDTVLTLKKEYLATLENGKHTFQLVTLGGSVDFEITVTNHAAAVDPEPDKGGCNCSSAIGGEWLLLSGVVLAVAAVIIIGKKRYDK